MCVDEETAEGKGAKLTRPVNITAEEATWEGVPEKEEEAKLEANKLLMPSYPLSVLNEKVPPDILKGFC